MRISKRACRILILIVLLVLTNAALSYLIEPYASSSGEMWQGYRQQADLDTIYVGTSQCLQGLDPEAIDPVLGSRSYNMATNMQSPADSLDAVQTAIAEHDLQRVILVIDHEILATDRADNFRAEASYVHAKAQNESLSAGLQDSFSFITSGDFIGRPISLLYWTPWVYNRSTNIALNVREKAAGTVLGDGEHRTARGYEPSDEIVSDEIPPFTTIEQAGQWDLENPDLASPTITQDNREILTEIADLCEEHDVDLVAIVVPYANWLDVYNAAGYLALRDALETLFTEHGAQFYDFNLIRTQYYEKERDDFRDVGHMNAKGASRFGTYLGAFLQDEESGADVSSYFLQTQEIDLTPRDNSKNEDPSLGL